MNEKVDKLIEEEEVLPPEVAAGKLAEELASYRPINNLNPMKLLRVRLEEHITNI